MKSYIATVEHLHGVDRIVTDCASCSVIDFLASLQRTLKRKPYIEIKSITISGATEVIDMTEDLLAVTSQPGTRAVKHKLVPRIKLHTPKYLAGSDNHMMEEFKALKLNTQLITDKGLSETDTVNMINTSIIQLLSWPDHVIAASELHAQEHLTMLVDMLIQLLERRDGVDKVSDSLTDVLAAVTAQKQHPVEYVKALRSVVETIRQEFTFRTRSVG